MTTLTGVAESIAPTGTKLHGEIVAWNIEGVKVRYADLLAALHACGLEPNVARELLPRHAFARACKKLETNRIIRLVSEDEDTLSFQFTAERKEDDRFEYTFETLLKLAKKTGKVSGELPGLVTHAQELVNEAIAVRTGGDVPRVVQKLFERKADLFSIRPAGGAYFVPQRHAEFLAAIQRFLGAVGGQMWRFPVPAGTPHGDRSVKEAVEHGLYDLIEEHRKAVAEFTADTRESTLARAAEKIRDTRFKILAYAEYLGAAKDGLMEQLGQATEELRKKLKELGSAA
jgi:hypothetical protein